jgi:uncharacterized protein
MNELMVAGPLAGGILIGLSASLLLLFNGRVAGVSGIFGGLLIPKAGDISWRAAFVVGLLLGGIGLALTYPAAFPAPTGDQRLGVVTVAGLLIGYGTRLGNGCTSGHGVCGISRLSVRSIVATLTFMASGVLTVYVHHHLIGAPR